MARPSTTIIQEKEISYEDIVNVFNLSPATLRKYKARTKNTESPCYTQPDSPVGLAFQQSLLVDEDGNKLCDTVPSGKDSQGKTTYSSYPKIKPDGTRRYLDPDKDEVTEEREMSKAFSKRKKEYRLNDSSNFFQKKLMRSDTDQEEIAKQYFDVREGGLPGEANLPSLDLNSLESIQACYSKALQEKIDIKPYHVYSLVRPKNSAATLQFDVKAESAKDAAGGAIRTEYLQEHIGVDKDVLLANPGDNSAKYLCQYIGTQGTESVDPTDLFFRIETMFGMLGPKILSHYFTRHIMSPHALFERIYDLVQEDLPEQPETQTSKKMRMLCFFAHAYNACKSELKVEPIFQNYDSLCHLRSIADDVYALPKNKVKEWFNPIKESRTGLEIVSAVLDDTTSLTDYQDDVMDFFIDKKRDSFIEALNIVRQKLADVKATPNIDGPSKPTIAHTVNAAQAAVEANYAFLFSKTKGMTGAARTSAILYQTWLSELIAKYVPSEVIRNLLPVLYYTFPATVLPSEGIERRRSFQDYKSDNYVTSGELRNLQDSTSATYKDSIPEQYCVSNIDDGIVALNQLQTNASTMQNHRAADNFRINNNLAKFESQLTFLTPAVWHATAKKIKGISGLNPGYGGIQDTDEALVLPQPSELNSKRRRIRNKAILNSFLLMGQQAEQACKIEYPEQDYRVDEDALQKSIEEFDSGRRKEPSLGFLKDFADAYDALTQSKLYKACLPKLQNSSSLMSNDLKQKAEQLKQDKPNEVTDALLKVDILRVCIYRDIVDKILKYLEKAESVDNVMVHVVQKVAIQWIMEDLYNYMKPCVYAVQPIVALCK